MAGGRRYSYSRWDGTQVGFDPDGLDVFAELTDDLLYHGDLQAALRRLLQDGFEPPDGDRIQGIRELLERLREARRERLERDDLGSVYGDIAERLREIVRMEREALDELAAEAHESGDERRRELTDEVVAERSMRLEMLPPDLAGQIRELGDHDFTSHEAGEAFDELVEELRSDLARRFIDDVTGAVGSMDEADRARMKDMMSALNEMLRQRQDGIEPDFDGFMDQYGDFFPENPRTLDELLDVMARRMAAASSMLASMTPEQRAQLQALADQLLEDMDLRWQVEELSRNLRDAFPDLQWDRNRQFSGDQPMSLASAGEAFEDLGDLDQLEQLLRGTASPGALADVDIERARQLLGPEAARSLEQLSELARRLEEAGLVAVKDGHLQLTAAGIRRIGQNALGELFRRLSVDQLGRHGTSSSGIGHERADDTKPYEWGDPFNLSIERTIRNALRRQGGGTPVQLTPDDFEVERTEREVRASTVLMLDLSLSMPMRDNFLPAKKVAMALHTLITTRFPRDWMGIVGFSEIARELRAEELPEVSWDFVYGTNMQHGFELSRRMLSRRSGTKQIIMITDGEPTAHIDAHGEVLFNYPPVRETIDLTLDQVLRATREGIRINTFMLDPTPHLRDFVEKLTSLNRGRAFFTNHENLGDYVLVDFLEQRRSMVRSRRAG